MLGPYFGIVFKIYPIQNLSFCMPLSPYPILFVIATLYIYTPVYILVVNLGQNYNIYTVA